MTRRSHDDGFTLIELVAAMGIFVALMAISTTVIVFGLKAITATAASSSNEQDAQNAAEWMSRALRYADNAHETVPVIPAVEYAGTTKITFTTFAGLGDIDRVPYKVTLQNSPVGITSTVWTPDMASGTPTYNDGVAAATTAVNAYFSATVNDVATAKCFTQYRACARVLVPKTTTNTPVLALSYATGNALAATTVTPAANASLTEAQRNALYTVTFEITGTEKGQSVSQTVVLENPRS